MFCFSNGRLRESRQSFRANNSLAARWPGRDAGAESTLNMERAQATSGVQSWSWRGWGVSGSNGDGGSVDNRQKQKQVQGTGTSGHGRCSAAENREQDKAAAQRKLETECRAYEKRVFVLQKRIMIVAIFSMLLAVVINEACVAGDYKVVVMRVSIGQKRGNRVGDQH